MTNPSIDSTGFTIRPAYYSELPAIAALLTKAFWNDDLFGDIIHPHRAQFPEDNDLYWLRRARVNWWDWSMRYIVSIVREAGRDVITGVALWARIGEQPPTGLKLGVADPSKNLRCIRHARVVLTTIQDDSLKGSLNCIPILQRGYGQTVLRALKTRTSSNARIIIWTICGPAREQSHGISSA
jgi:hypothetical protein